ncbi:ABC transporter ATP-binding protein [Furfurilactobacillus siliginis]|uniref:ABC superfamily ATP binding cassette transporter, ABC protein n=1 Tax=Furfurilactobacillus siliginis TaxID=348151 RepID=A0A0R2L6C6_9LACO|nr:ABC transporter ATP-binding protein [Furfurilactobacillus siliginis]KRN95461.1 ABC superfamily ATP binding cassette transporter, ABC protein [Furfurilactobacillus siliginis]GEK28234.1 ABC transporter ATP-binding protein [Furfurilactobacillus siliginis]
MQTTPIVDVKNLQKIYGAKKEKQYEALTDINFAVAPGEFVGIMGPSGSGKTTLLNLLSTLDVPTAGSVRINNQEVSHLKGKQLADFRAQQVGFIFQDFNLLESLTARENISLPLSLQDVPRSKTVAAVEEVAQTLSIADLLDKYPAELSGGQKQRVAAARALVHHPAIIMGDEPTGALDSKSARELLDLLSNINQQQNVPVLLVTHDPFSASFCDRILFIQDGRIKQELSRQGQARKDFYGQILEQLGTFEQ